MNWTFIRPVAAVAFASVAGCVLLVLRFLWLGHARNSYLVWNLFLAWLPLWFALGTAIALRWKESTKAKWSAGGFALAWLLFFPNAPYILTDVVHVTSRAQRHFWPDLVLILLFALAGLILGFLSLFVMQRLVVRRFGWVAGWGFVAAAATLNGFGVYAGRFLRWNSWDVVVAPWNIAREGTRWVLSMPHTPRAFLLPMLFAALMFIAYVMLYGLTHLGHWPAQPTASGSPPHRGSQE
jgi:uncharacterized membrane protein